MSVIIASGEAISKSPINQSKSKQMFSFPKSPRFTKLNSSRKGAKFYDLPVVLSKRATSFGLGKKYDFTREKKNMQALFYDHKSDFDQAHSYTPRYSFGIGRDKYEKVYYESNKYIDKQIPGPGKYNIARQFGLEALKFSMKGRNNSTGREDAIPGPGQYPNSLQINERGKYFSSKVANIAQINFGADKSKRSQFDGNDIYIYLFIHSFSANKNPGPLDYPQKQLMGKIFNSRYVSSPIITLHAKLREESRNNNPGPGAYRAFSEFGIYESRTANHSPSKQIDN